MAADVYANESHRGRGGWTWYTGSAGWMYQFITGSLLGFEQRGDQLQFRPCLPPGWDGFTVDYRWGKSVYHIRITRLADVGAAGAAGTAGAAATGAHTTAAATATAVATVVDTIVLVDDGVEHEVELFVR
jgi:cellobiose phosphorylase